MFCTTISITVQAVRNIFVKFFQVQKSLEKLLSSAKYKRGSK